MESIFQRCSFSADSSFKKKKKSLCLAFILFQPDVISFSLKGEGHFEKYLYLTSWNCSRA